MGAGIAVGAAGAFPPQAAASSKATTSGYKAFSAFITGGIIAHPGRRGYRVMSSVPGLSGAVGFGRRTRGPSGAGLLFPEAGEYGFALVSIGQQIHFANPGGYDPGGYIGIGAPGAEYMLNYVLSAAVAAGPPVVFPLISSDRSPPPNFPGFVAICAAVITRFGIPGFRLMPLNESPQIFGRLKGLELNADVWFAVVRTRLP